MCVCVCEFGSISTCAVCSRKPINESYFKCLPLCMDGKHADVMHAKVKLRECMSDASARTQNAAVALSIAVHGTCIFVHRQECSLAFSLHIATSNCFSVCVFSGFNLMKITFCLQRIFSFFLFLCFIFISLLTKRFQVLSNVRRFLITLS